MRKSRTMRKTLSAIVAGGMMFQFGGCGDFIQLTARNIPIGFGRGLGTGLLVPIVLPFIEPIIGDFIGGDAAA